MKRCLSRSPVTAGCLGILLIASCKPRVENDSIVKDAEPPVGQAAPGLGLERHALEGEFSPLEDMTIKGLTGAIASKVTTMRDAHPKAHGCAYNAEFEVDRGLKVQYRKGIFATPGRRFNAIARFSSGSSNPASDDKTEGSHGLALKILLNENEQNLVAAIPGEQFHNQSDTPRDLLGDTKKPVSSNDLYKSFDIITINALSEFVVDGLKDYGAFFKAAATRNFGEYLGSIDDPMAKGFIAANLGKLGAHQTSNLLSERYNSWVPYAYDESRAVKYSFVPLNCVKKPKSPFKSSHPDVNYLGKDLKAQLNQQGTACFKVVAQFHSADMPSIENASYPWGKENERKYVDLGKLTLRNKFTSESFCQALSFNPAHALPNQRGIGATQRARRVIYAAIANQRITNVKQTAESAK